MAITLVQNVGTTSTGSGSTCVLTVASGHGTTLANFGILRCSAGLTARTLSSVTDSQGNTWEVDADNATASAPGVASCKFATALGTGDTITAHFSGTVTDPLVTVDEFSGLDPTTWFSAASAVKNASSGALSTNAVTVPAFGLVIGAWGSTSNPGTLTPGTGYTALTGNSAGGFAPSTYGVYQIDSGAGGSYTPNATTTSSVWRGFAVAYKAAGGTGHTQELDYTEAATWVAGRSISVTKNVTQGQTSTQNRAVVKAPLVWAQAQAATLRRAVSKLVATVTQATTAAMTAVKNGGTHAYTQTLTFTETHAATLARAIAHKAAWTQASSSTSSRSAGKQIAAAQSFEDEGTPQVGPFFGDDSNGSEESGADWDIGTIGNVFAEDDVYVTNPSDGNQTAPLRIIGLSEASGITDTIVGVEVHVSLLADTDNAWTDLGGQPGATFVYDSTDTYFGTDHSGNPNFVRTFKSDLIYGGPTDMWGQADSDWKTAFADPDFGFQWRGISQIGLGVGTLYCDSISLIVYLDSVTESAAEMTRQVGKNAFLVSQASTVLAFRHAITKAVAWAQTLAAVITAGNGARTVMLAFTQASAATAARASSIRRAATQATATILRRAVAKLVSPAAQTSSATEARGAGKSQAVTQAESGALSRASSKTVVWTQSQALTVRRAVARSAVWAQTQSSAMNRAVSKLQAAATQAWSATMAELKNGGSRAFTQTLTFTQAQAATLGRAVAIARSWTQTQAASLIRGLAKGFTVAQGGAATERRAGGKQETTAQTEAALLSRATAKAVAFAQGGAATLRKAAARTFTAGQATSTTETRASGKYETVTQGGTVTLTRKISKTTLATQATVSTLARATDRALTATEHFTATLAARRTAFVTLTATQGSASVYRRATTRAIVVGVSTAFSLSKRVGQLLAWAQQQLATLETRRANLVPASFTFSGPRGAFSFQPVEGAFTFGLCAPAFSFQLVELTP